MQAAPKPFNLQGMAIGNGLTNPAIQYASYADFSFANGLISKGLQRTINAVRPNLTHSGDSSYTSNKV